MAELYGWHLFIEDYEHNDDGPFTNKYYIQRRNAVEAGAVFLGQLLEENEWEDDWMTEAQQKYQELINTVDPMANVTTPVDSYFDDNSIRIELTLIPYEDELK